MTQLTDPSLTLKITRKFDAPRELVWRAWTDPAHLMRWYCPKDFTVLFAEADVRPGGTWRSAMRDPDGCEYIHHGTYEQVREPEQLIFTHAWEKNHLEPPANTRITLTLTEQAGQTHMTFEQVGFATVASRDSHGEGWSEAFENIAIHLADASIITDEHELVITRTFDAPRDLVWEAWTQPGRMMQWMYCAECEGSFAENDLTPGGAWRAGMRMANGKELIVYGRYREITPPHRLAFTHRWLNNEAMPDVNTLVTVTFTERHNQTEMMFRQVGFATAASRDAHNDGWCGALVGLARHLVNTTIQGATHERGPTAT